MLSDSAGTWSTVGNQQAEPVPALMEKLVNSIDSTLISACIQHGKDPKSPEAPQTMFEAVEEFFGVPNGELGDISSSDRSRLSQQILLVCTGLPKKNPCYTIVDQAEGQTPTKIHSTILSLPGKKGAKPNKKDIPFVQGIQGINGIYSRSFIPGICLNIVYSVTRSG